MDLAAVSAHDELAPLARVQMSTLSTLSFVIAWLSLVRLSPAQETMIRVDARQILHPVSRYLTGACLEDVNHEVYGGIDSQMIFGESFAEPVPQMPIKGFKTFGHWSPEPGGVRVTGGEGSKLVPEKPAFEEGEASVEVKFNDRGNGNAGLIVKVSDAGKGQDEFNGYEVAIEPDTGRLLLGRHRQNWEYIRHVPCPVSMGEWIRLTVQMKSSSLEVFVNGKSITQYEDREHPLRTGSVGLRTWQRDASYRNFVVRTGNQETRHDFVCENANGWGQGVSSQWRPLRRGTADGQFALVKENAFSGRHSQQLTFASGTGEIGLENRGLNRWGMNFVAGKPYEGYVYVRAQTPTPFLVALESGDGARVLTEKQLIAQSQDWQRIDFTLRPKGAEGAGRFAIKLKAPGTVTVGYAFLQPGSWGRFRGLPVRKDVAEGLVNQGITVLRFGGSMINSSGYRWKEMFGPRQRRQPYNGTWYPYSSRGWGVLEFLDLCAAAGFLGIPDLNVDETPQDMADFIEYVNGDADTDWGRKRAATGRREPYHLKYVELGNEERVDESYFGKFKALAEAIWAKDSQIILIVGDFAYGKEIKDPFNFSGAASGITNLVAHQKILQLAKQHDREVWFDVHIGTEGPRPDFGGFFSYVDALKKIADGAKHRLLTFEFNAGNHSQRRAVANAAAIVQIERDGRIPISTSANCLQADGQNDNDWNQGLLFLNPSQVWLQPPGYVTQMFSRNYQPLLVQSDMLNDKGQLAVSAKRSEDGQSLVLTVVNMAEQPMTSSLSLLGFKPRRSSAKVLTLTGGLEARNTAHNPELITPTAREWSHGLRDGSTAYTFAPNSVTVIQF
jgi:hypothetical protein